MMTSPEEYYEYHLKGKSAEQIMTQIRGLKREINRLIRILEHPDYEQTIDPGEDVQLYCTWEYLERAKSALAEAGGTYVPTKAEQKELVFLENMPYICSIIFSIGGFFSGYETRIFTIDEQVNLRVENLFAAESNESERKLELTKEELFDGLRSLHIGQWRRKYENSSVMDGTQWDLTIVFSNGHRKICISGSNAYPYNFRDFLDLLGVPGGEGNGECYDDAEDCSL